MNYTIDDFDIEKIGRGGMGFIPCRVKGYWSTDTISLYINRGWSDKGWTIRVSYASGGRDTEVVESDVEATRYFAEALVAMCDLADKITASTDVLEAAYQAKLKELAVEVAKERAEKEARIATDPELGVSRAREIVGEMLAKRYCTVAMYERGTTGRPVAVSLVTGAKSVFYIAGDRVSRQEVINSLAKASARSAIMEG